MDQLAAFFKTVNSLNLATWCHFRRVCWVLYFGSMSTQLIRRLPGETFIVIRSNYLELCNGNVVAAGLIHIFERWHIHKTQGIDQNNKANAVALRHEIAPEYRETLLQWHTTKELEQQLLGLGKRDSIQIARRQLVQLGIISEHKNPNPRYAFDNTNFFLFHPDVLNQLLDLKADQRKTVRPPDEIADTSAENRQEPGDNRHYTNNTSNNTANESDINSPAQERGGPAEPVKLKKGKGKKQPAGPPDKDWQRWVDAWFIFHQNHNDGRKPPFKGAQSSALKDLREYLCDVATPVENQSRDDTGFAAFQYILANWKKLTPWQQSTFDLTVILKKISEFLNSLKNGTTTNRGNNSGGAKPGTSAERIDAITNY